MYDGDRLIAELGASGTTVLRRYVHGAGVDEPVLWWQRSGKSPGLDNRDQQGLERSARSRAYVNDALYTIATSKAFATIRSVV